MSVGSSRALLVSALQRCQERDGPGHPVQPRALGTELSSSRCEERSEAFLGLLEKAASGDSCPQQLPVGQGCPLRVQELQHTKVWLWRTALGRRGRKAADLTDCAQRVF